MIIIINGIEVDLNKLGVDFIPNDEQIKALGNLADFMESDKLTTVLSGGAGVGKTSIVKIFLEYVRIKHRYSIKLVAPTHKAKSILSRLSNNLNATTLHSLLGLKPNFNILEFDAKDMKFLDSLIFFDIEKELIVIDEASMIPDDLYDMLVTKMQGKGKMLFLGDDRQLRPVKQEGVSKVFYATDFPGSKLTKIERQTDNPLLDTLVTLRDTDEVTYKTKIKGDKGIVLHKSMLGFKEAVSETFFSLEVLNNSPHGSKIIAYTNARVDGFNAFARNLMGIFKVPINVGENLVATDTYNKGGAPILYNGSEYIVTRVMKTTVQIPKYGPFPGYLMCLKEVHTDYTVNVQMLDPEASERMYEHLGIVIENARLTAIKRKYLWKVYFSIVESFITMKDINYQGRTIKKKTVDYGYAITSHKSQGSTYTNVFVDIDNMSTIKDHELKRQLQYVALSRPTNFAHILKTK